jgi:hypothetical protein
LAGGLATVAVSPSTSSGAAREDSAFLALVAELQAAEQSLKAAMAEFAKAEQ